MKETPLLHAIRAALAAQPGVMILRNNTGVDIRRGVRYGLGNGGADLVGLLAPGGRWIAFEVKTPEGRLSEDQKRWHSAIRKHGGFVAVVRSVGEALAALDDARVLKEAR